MHDEWVAAATAAEWSERVAGFAGGAGAAVERGVPERVARGATATGFLAFFGPNEFVIDFLQFLSRPANLVARVVMTPAVAEQFLGVLRENMAVRAAIRSAAKQCRSRRCRRSRGRCRRFMMI